MTVKFWRRRYQASSSFTSGNRHVQASIPAHVYSRHHEEQGDDHIDQPGMFPITSAHPPPIPTSKTDPESNNPIRQKIRQSWSKYNLFNLTRMRTPPTAFRTHFQQKFKAKSIARAYHGEQVRESQWQRMFSSRIRSVIPMDPYNLAKDDGAGAAAGRGSGLAHQSDRTMLGIQQAKQYIPFSQMTFAPLERRLDVAVFRALFASSTRQARQFVIHGAVTVNGQKVFLSFPPLSIWF